MVDGAGARPCPLPSVLMKSALVAVGLGACTYVNQYAGFACSHAGSPEREGSGPEESRSFKRILVCEKPEGRLGSSLKRTGGSVHKVRDPVKCGALTQCAGIRIERALAR